MAATKFNGGSYSPRTLAYAAKEMLAHAEPQMCLAKYGMTKPMPKNKAETVKFRRAVPFPLATGGLTEGVTPAARAMTYEDITVTLDQYGDLVSISDRVDDLGEDPVLKDASMLCGEQAGETIERLIWDVLQTGTSVFRAGGGATRATVNGPITLNLQRQATRLLKNNRAMKITSMVSSSVKYGTEAIDAAYLAFGHTDLEADLRNTAGFVPTEKYGSMKALPYEIGKIEDVRYILTPVLAPFINAGAAAGSTLVTTGGTAADVYPLIVVGKDSYGHVALKGSEAITPTILNPGTPDKADPLGQIGYVGWKTYHKAFIANDAWMTRIEVAASRL